MKKSKGKSQNGNASQPLELLELLELLEPFYLSAKISAFFFLCGLKTTKARRNTQGSQRHSLCLLEEKQTEPRRHREHRGMQRKKQDFICLFSNSVSSVSLWWKNGPEEGFVGIIRFYYGASVHRTSNIVHEVGGTQIYRRNPHPDSGYQPCWRLNERLD